MAILQIETKARLTGDRMVFGGGLMGGDEWVRVYRVLLDGEPASEWVKHELDNSHLADLASQSGERESFIRAILTRKDRPRDACGSSGWGLTPRMRKPIILS